MSLLNWIYLPKPKKQRQPFPALRDHRTNFSRLYQRRRSNRDEHFRFYKLVLGLFLVVFALRVGSAVMFTMHHPLGFWAAMYADGVHLPKAEAGQEIYGPRFYLLISITEDGVVEFDGERVAQEGWRKYLVEFRHMEPRGRALFLVDRHCPMEHVQEVITVLREVGISDMVFATSRRDDTFL